MAKSRRDLQDKQAIAELFAEAAQWGAVRLDDTELRRAKISPQAFEAWVLDDVVDTVEQMVKSDQYRHLTVRTTSGGRALRIDGLGAIFMTHVRLAFRAGLLLGQGDIGKDDG